MLMGEWSFTQQQKDCFTQQRKNVHTPPLPLLRCSSRLGLLLILKVPPEASLLTATDEES